MTTYRTVKSDGQTIQLRKFHPQATGWTVFVNGVELGAVRGYTRGYVGVGGSTGENRTAPSIAEGARMLHRMYAAGWPVAA